MCTHTVQNHIKYVNVFIYTPAKAFAVLRLENVNT